MAAKDGVLISGASLSYGLGDATTTPATLFIEMEEVIVSIPEFYSKPDTIDTTTINNTTLTNIPALSGGDSLDFTVLVNDSMYAYHAAIYAAQIAEATGPCWFQLKFASPARTITWQGVVPSNLVINGGGGADLNQGVLAIYPSSDFTDIATV